MNNIFKQLAEHLDRIPNGFPETESGVELKILAKLFTPEEAEVACTMSLKPLSTKTIAEKYHLDERQTFILLKGMVKKGLIDIERVQDGLLFIHRMVYPSVVLCLLQVNSSFHLLTSA